MIQWTEAKNGVLVPPSALKPDARFDEFMGTLSAHLPEIQGWMSKSLASRPPQTPVIDPLDFAQLWQGVKEPQGHLTMSNDVLRNMSAACPIISAIISTRCNQIAAFCQIPESETDVGFKIALRDADRQPTKDEMREMREIADMIVECGFVEAEDVRPDITFEEFVRKITRDSLELDAAVFEVIPGYNRVKYPVVAFQPLDAGMIRLTEPTEYHPKRDGVKNVAGVMVHRGEIVAEYGRDEFAYGVRNPCTNMTRRGYGTSELEWLTKIVSCILFGIDYNEKYFTTSSVPPGVLAISAPLDPETLAQFRRQWAAQMQGVGNQWHTPVINTKDTGGVTYTKFRDTNRDMEYHQFLAFMITVACSVYNIHPEEIGMQSWAPQTTALSQPSPQSRIESSIDRGLKPILKMISNLLNKKIMWQMYPDKKYIFRWVNIDPADEERELKLREMRLNMGLTIPSQEIKKADMEQHAYSDVPVNPQHFQVYMAKLEAEQAKQQPEEVQGEVQGENQQKLQQKDDSPILPESELENGEENKQAKLKVKKSLTKPKIIEVQIYDD